MKFCIAFLAFIVISFFSFSQTIPKNPNITDAKGLRQGKWTILYDAEWKQITEELKAVYYRLITYADDKPIGMVRDYFASGLTQWEGKLLQDRPHEVNDGEAIWFKPDGSKEKLRLYDKGKLLKEIFFNIDGSETSDNWIAIDKKAQDAYYKGDYKEATLQWEKALIQAEKEFGTDHIAYSTALNNLGFSYWITGRYREAEKMYLRSFTICERLLGSEHPSIADMLNNLAVLYQEMGAIDQAEAKLIRSKNIRLKNFGENSEPYAQALNNLASLYNKMGIYDKAELLGIAANRIYEKVLGTEHPLYALSLNNLADLYNTMGRYENAEPLFIQAKNIRGKVLGKEHHHYARSLFTLAGLYRNMGFYSQAEPLYLEAKKISEKVLGVEHPEYADLLTNLAILYQDMTLYNRAEDLFTEAKRIRQKVYGKESALYAASLNNMGMLYVYQGLYKAAELPLLESKDLFEKSLGKDRPDYANTLNSLGRLYAAKGSYERAESMYLEAMRIREKIFGKDHPLYIFSLRNLATLYYTTGNEEKARPLYVEYSQRIIKSLQRYFPSLSEQQKEKYYLAVQESLEVANAFAFHHKDNNAQLFVDIYNLRLSTKGILFNDSEKIRKKILSSGEDSLIELFDSWRYWRNQLAKAYQMTWQERKLKNMDVDSITQLIELKEKLLSKRSKLFEVSQDTTQFSWTDVQKRLGKNEAAVEMIRFRKYGVQKIVTDSSDVNLKRYPVLGLTDTIQYAILILTPKSSAPEYVVIRNGNDLEGKFLANYKNNIQFKLIDTISYKQFWQPVSVVLKKHKIKRVYLSPDGVYNSINLSVLQNPNTAKYLMDELKIRLVTNTKDLIIRKQELKNKISNASLFGYPDYSEQDSVFIRGKDRQLSFRLDSAQRFFFGGVISRLPGTEKEVTTINRLLTANGINASQYLEKTATEEEIKTLYNPLVLHIATHGFFLRDVDQTRNLMFAGFETKNLVENPLLRSGLLMTGSQKTVNGERNMEKEDGILTAYEAMNLSLDSTDLVVLSACETGLGEIRNGEGVYGLQRAFQTAGAKSILMSLWKVDDNATQELMISFYKNWLKSGDKHDAFKKAQGTVRSKYKHPYYWGAFVLVGE